MRSTFYISTPIYYPNARLHMGHAYTTTLCDVIARYHRVKGDSTYFLSGADENTEKVVREAKKQGVDTHAYLDSVVAQFISLYQALDITNDQFIRTSDTVRHWPGAQAMWKRLVEAGDIYKRAYRGLYCVGAETFVTEKDLRPGGLCPDHDEAPVVVKEENYFFRLSQYTERIKEKIVSGELLILPASRKTEILALLERGLEDVSFSRPAEKVTLGVPVPGDATQKMYVWCDALTNYITALGYGQADSTLLQTYWPANLHVVGKDILRFHAALWPAMLMSAKLPLPRAILVHGMITSGGRKMSKSLGNVIDPLLLIEEYGSEAVRYYLAREISPFEDGDMTVEKFKEVYNANLANGLGNLASRIMTMAEKYLNEPAKVKRYPFPHAYEVAFANYDIKAAADFVWSEIGRTDAYIQDTQPFLLVKFNKEAAVEVILELVGRLSYIADMLVPFLPRTAEAIHRAVAANKKTELLFPRKE